jgi:hypothetical protein
VDDAATLSLCGNHFVDNSHGAIFVGRDAANAQVEILNNVFQGTLWLGSKTSLSRLTESDNTHISGEGVEGVGVGQEEGEQETGGGKGMKGRGERESRCAGGGGSVASLRSVGASSSIVGERTPF